MDEKKYLENILLNNQLPIVINYNDHLILKTQNGQSWNRRESSVAKKYKIFAVNGNKTISNRCFRYVNPSKNDNRIVEKLIKKFENIKGNQIQGLIIIGHRTIKDNIRVPFSKKDQSIIKNRDNNRCVVCGSKKDLQVDHKDDEYNSSELSHKDGQLLCSHCNTLKRGGNSDKRVNRISPPFLNGLNKYFDMSSYNFWYDPKDWIQILIQKIKEKLQNKDENIRLLKKRIEEQKNEINKLKQDNERYRRRNKNDI